MEKINVTAFFIQNLISKTSVTTMRNIETLNVSCQKNSVEEHSTVANQAALQALLYSASSADTP